MTQLLYVVLGVVAGICGGMFGIGGGVILIPALVFIFGLTQHQAQGTTLAILVPKTPGQRFFSAPGASTSLLNQIHS